MELSSARAKILSERQIRLFRRSQPQATRTRKEAHAFAWVTTRVSAPLEAASRPRYTSAASTNDGRALTSTPPARSAKGPTYKGVAWTARTPQVAPTAQARMACQLKPPLYQ